MEFLKRYKYQIIYQLVLNFVFATFITFSSYYHLPLSEFKGYAIFFIHLLVNQFTVFGFLYFLSLNRLIFRIAFPFIFVSFSMFTYWVYLLDITATESIIQAIIESKLDIAIDLITFPFVIFILASLVVSLFLLKIYNGQSKSKISSPLTLLAALAIFVFLTDTYYFNVLKLTRRQPYSFVYAIKDYINKKDIVLSPLKKNPTSTINKFNIVFVLGESVRADHLSLNGYPRNTTPNLSKNNNIISFSNIFTPLTYTAISVPQILTNISIEKDSVSNENITSIYSILNKINYNTIWIGNQTPEKSYNSFISENHKTVIIDPFRSVLSFEKEKDSKLIPILNNNFSENHSNQFITIHMIGSHWLYQKRISDSYKVFQPTAKSKYIPSNTKEEMINSYDNTIVYLDTFLTEIISQLDSMKKESIVIYLSDHGEVLGEDGKWLHAQNHKASQNPAMLIWYSDEFNQKYPFKIDNLKANKTKQISTDFFFHSILDLLQVENYKFDKSKSVFN